MHVLRRLFYRDDVLRVTISTGTSRLQNWWNRQRLDIRRQATISLVTVAADKCTTITFTGQRVGIGTGVVSITAGTGWLWTLVRLT